MNPNWEQHACKRSLKWVFPRVCNVYEVSFPLLGCMLTHVTVGHFTSSELIKGVGKQHFEIICTNFMCAFLCPVLAPVSQPSGAGGSVRPGGHLSAGGGWEPAFGSSGPAAQLWLQRSAPDRSGPVTGRLTAALQHSRRWQQGWVSAFWFQTPPLCPLWIWGYRGVREHPWQICWHNWLFSSITSSCKAEFVTAVPAEWWRDLYCFSILAFCDLLMNASAFVLSSLPWNASFHARLGYILVT